MKKINKLNLDELGKGRLECGWRRNERNITLLERKINELIDQQNKEKKPKSNKLKEALELMQISLGPVKGEDADKLVAKAGILIEEYIEENERN